MILPLIVITTLLITARWFLSQYFYRKPIYFNQKSLCIRGESFNLEHIDYLTYNKQPLPNDDYLKIKVKGYPERHICIYEQFYKEELRLYHFLKNNFEKTELKKGA